MLRPAIFIILLGISLLYFFSLQDQSEEQAETKDQSPQNMMEASEELNPESEAETNSEEETIEVIVGHKK